MEFFPNRYFKNRKYEKCVNANIHSRRKMLASTQVRVCWELHQRRHADKSALIALGSVTGFFSIIIDSMHRCSSRDIADKCNKA